MHESIAKLNEDIVHAHHAHYTEITPLGLVEPDMQPNENCIFHLYSDGAITYQPGGTAYLTRRELFIVDEFQDFKKMKMMEFVKSSKHKDLTYVILTKEECMDFRKKWDSLISSVEH
jgi:hypothetical protein